LHIDTSDVVMGPLSAWLLVSELDAHEIPTDWPTGFIRLGKIRPYEEPVEADDPGSGHRLSP
jgi:hypothetical protein